MCGYLNTSPRGFRLLESHANNTLWFLVIENHIGYFAEFGTFVADVLFDVEDSGGVLLCAVRYPQFFPRKVRRTLISSSVNICFRITTFSNFELVFAIIEGSSSSQSASLLSS